MERIIAGEDAFVEFKIKQFWGLVKVSGQMLVRQLRLDVADPQPGNWKVSAEVDPSSIATGNPRRDKHLKSPMFFDTDRFPSILFVSTNVEPVEENRFRVSGELTIRGITRQVSLEVTEVAGTSRIPAEFRGTTTLSRRDFGLNFNKMPIGSEVEITIQLKVSQATEFLSPVKTA